MIQIVLHRRLSSVVACSDGMQWERGDTSHGWQGKSADLRRAHVVGWFGHFGHRANSTCWRLRHKAQQFQRSTRRQSLFYGLLAS
jgi:hypothetical protein